MLSGADPNDEKEKDDHARLPAQVPASRVSRNPGGNNRQERMDAVSGQKDGNRGADNAWARQQDRATRRSSAFGRKPQCEVVSIMKKLRQLSCGNFRHFANSYSGGHSYRMARTTCNCRHHREGTSMREKRQRFLTVSSRISREHGINGATLALESPGKRKNVSEGRLSVNWIPTSGTLKNVFVEE